jgi:hypothetical protein
MITDDESGADVVDRRGRRQAALRHRIISGAFLGHQWPAVAAALPAFMGLALWVQRKKLEIPFANHIDTRREYPHRCRLRHCPWHCFP